eukprot:m.227095 g.227095  ORF g.227095 m.227095 type:complete len:99 (+) comp15173_c0_seq9:1533-1829(+)
MGCKIGLRLLLRQSLISVTSSGKMLRSTLDTGTVRTSVAEPCCFKALELLDNVAWVVSSFPALSAGSVSVVKLRLARFQALSASCVLHFFSARTSLFH